MVLYLVIFLLILLVLAYFIMHESKSPILKALEDVLHEEYKKRKLNDKQFNSLIEKALNDREIKTSIRKILYSNEIAQALDNINLVGGYNTINSMYINLKRKRKTA